MNESKIKIILKYWKSLIILLLIFILCAIHGDDVEKVKFIEIPYFDKIIHFGMYFSMAFVFMRDFTKNSEKPLRWKIILVTIICFLTGLIVEILQELIFASRSGSFYDMIANIFGTITGIYFFFFLLKR